MSVTLTTAADRDQRLHRATQRRLGAHDGVLVLMSIAALMVIWWSYSGRFFALDFASEASDPQTAVNLSTIADASSLDSPLAIAFESSSDRALATTALFQFVTNERAARRTMPNVGLLSRAQIRADVIIAAPRASIFADRLRIARETASARGHQPPDMIPVLSGQDLAAVKPRLVVRTRDEFRRTLIRWAIAYVAGFHLIALMWKARGMRGDILLLVSAHALTAIGFALLVSRPDPLRDTLLFVRYAQGLLLAQALLGAVSQVRFSSIASIELSFLPLGGALLLSAILILFGSGPGTSAAKVNLGPLQPIEAIRLLLALFLAGYFARHWELLRGARERTIRRRTIPGWIDLPRGEYVLPVFVGVVASLLFFFLQKDLGPALFICWVFLAVYGVARGRMGMVVVGMTVLILGFYVGYRLEISHTLAERVEMWRSPWDNAAAGGDQVAHAIWAMSTGGWAGSGLGLGSTRYLPAGHTDLILAALGEEWGIVGFVVVASLYAAMAWRGFHIARRAPNDYGFFLALTLTLFLIVPVLIMTSGVIGLAPLTGVVTPFLSYGGSAMSANFVALALLMAIRTEERERLDAVPFMMPLRWLGGALATAAIVLAAFVIRIQTVSANVLVVKPHLGVQGDGGRRFAYNPRLLDIVREVPRGTIYDRARLPLATDDRAVLDTARTPYAALNVPIAIVCPTTSGRCYPLGGAAFHLLGDARSRTNWTAPNASYVERDEEGALRGFDDHATSVRTTDSNGSAMTTLQRDYSDLVPVLRHHYDRHHPAVVAFHQRSRDIHLTVDAALQQRASTIVARYAKAAAGRAAAVVVDADSGALLASASYPWPDLDTDEGAALVHSRHDDPLLDRARFGLYPPGSTFKLVTAVAALRRHDGSEKTPFTCSRLPDGRIGATISGWARPIRDDVKDTHPHGTIDMHEGLVHSCNAYFAQLAVALGSDALLDTATRLGISLTPASNQTTRVHETLPQIGYGQGDVVVSPLRMARLVAAIANGGTLVDVDWHVDNGERRKRLSREAFLDAASARVLATDMRDAVMRGTGRALRDHSVRIAGKTGTAEVNGKPSHSWFAGFTMGPAGKRIAFAVIVENAGYGSASAVPAAGDIVTAAVASGLAVSK